MRCFWVLGAALALARPSPAWAGPVLTFEQFDRSLRTTVGDGGAADAGPASLQVGVGPGGAFLFGDFLLSGGPLAVQAWSNWPGSASGAALTLAPVTVTNTGTAPHSLRISVEEDFGLTAPGQPSSSLRLVEAFDAFGLASGGGVRFQAGAFAFPAHDPNVPPRALTWGPLLTAPGQDGSTLFNRQDNFGLLFRADIMLQPGESITLSGSALATPVPEPSTLVVLLSGLALGGLALRRRHRPAGA